MEKFVLQGKPDPSNPSQFGRMLERFQADLTKLEEQVTELAEAQAAVMEMLIEAAKRNAKA